MRKLITILFFCLLLLSPSLLFSQRMFISIGPELAVPGKYEQSNNNRGTGIGGSLRFESKWSNHVSGMATAGYISFAEAAPYSYTPTYTNKVSSVPIQVGIKYYTSKKHETANGLFFAPQVGIMPTTTNITNTDGSKQKLNEFCVSSAFGIGYLIKNIELNTTLQQNLSNTGYHIYYYGFRVAYAFMKKRTSN